LSIIHYPLSIVHCPFRNYPQKRDFSTFAAFFVLQINRIMKQTPFTTLHRRAGARMAEFAGYEMPIEYVGIVQEHLAVCRSIGLFDVSHMGEFRLCGKQAFDLLQMLTSNNAAALPAGKAQYSCLMNAQGGIVDDLVVYCREPQNNYLVVVNAANIDKDFAHFAKYAPQFDVQVGSGLTNISEHIAQIAAQGPKALSALQSIIEQPIMDMPNYTFKEVQIAGAGSVLFATTGYTGAGGGELYIDLRHTDAIKVWEAVMQAGQKFDAMPVGLGARDTLRLEMGYCLYGHELNDTTTPLEANLGWITKFSKDFLGMDVLQKQQAEGLRRKLIAFKMQERGIPRGGYDICSSNGEQIGVVTSGSISPTSKEGIGLGYVSIENAAAGTIIYVKIRDKLLAGEVVKLPFRAMQAQ
jgi:aminomethyltransferase